MSRDYGEHCRFCKQYEARKGFLYVFEMNEKQFKSVYIIQCLNKECGRIYSETKISTFTLLKAKGTSERAYKDACKEVF